MTIGVVVGVSVVAAKEIKKEMRFEKERAAKETEEKNQKAQLLPEIVLVTSNVPTGETSVTINTPMKEDHRVVVPLLSSESSSDIMSDSCGTPTLEKRVMVPLLTV